MGKTVYPSQYKTRIVLEVLKEEKTLGEIASDNAINPNMVRNWRREFLEKAPLMFEESKREQELTKKSQEMTVERAELMKTIGELTVERDWLKKNLQKHLGVNTKKSLVSDESGLTIGRQCELLGLNRSTYYYREVAQTESERQTEEKAKGRLDYWHTKMPYMGARKLRKKLQEEGHEIGKKLLKRYMGEMGIYAIYPKPRLSQGDKEQSKSAYLLRGMAIYVPNQVWAIDITYIAMAHGHMFLTAIIDWYSRYIVGWELSDTLESAPVLAALRGAVETYGVPGIVNSDQGTQFTGEDYRQYLKSLKVRQSMDSNV